MHKIRIRKFIDQLIVISCVCTILTLVIGYSINAVIYSPEEEVIAVLPEQKGIIVIDPGHGGEDGGAVAQDGTVEKNLNLEFGKSLSAICKILGMDVCMTRETDEMLYDKYSDLADYNGKKKTYDLKNRLRFTNEIGDNAVFVGIHMNKFPESKYSGTQVYYSPNSPSSKDLAYGVQSKIKEILQPMNSREIKMAGSSIFLLWRLKSPAILIECGFLSNEAETAVLKSSEYKKEFSLATAVALGEFMT